MTVVLRRLRDDEILQRPRLAGVDAEAARDGVGQNHARTSRIHRALPANDPLRSWTSAARRVSVSGSTEGKTP